MFEYDADKAYEELIATEDETDDGAYDALIAFCAHDAVPCKDPVMVGAFKLPVTLALPEMITVPVNVCISAVESPKMFEPEEYITDAVSYIVLRYVMEAVPFTVMFPFTITSCVSVFKYDAVRAFDADMVLSAYEADVEFNAYEALVALSAYEAVIATSACEALVALLE